MQTSNINVGRLEDGTLDVVTYGGGITDKIDVVGLGISQEVTEAKSALYALSDFVVFEDFDLTVSEEGFHVKKAKVGLLTAFRATNIAVVSTDYQGSFFDGLMDIPSDEENPTGWAVVNRRRGRFYTTPIQKDGDGFARARKHDFIDEMLAGFGLEIHVRGFNSNKDESGMGPADKVVHSWTLDPEEARAFRAEGYKNANARRQLRKEYLRARGQVQGDSTVSAVIEEKIAEEQTFKVPGFKGQNVTLVAGTIYCRKGATGKVQTMPYSPVSVQSVQQVLNMANKGWQFANNKKG
jgi:hypothetical protein